MEELEKIGNKIELKNLLLNINKNYIRIIKLKYFIFLYYKKHQIYGWIINLFFKKYCYIAYIHYNNAFDKLEKIKTTLLSKKEFNKKNSQIKKYYFYLFLKYTRKKENYNFINNIILNFFNEKLIFEEVYPRK